jgi:3-mercaptopyruvate sulfurtransferase SseA
MQVYSYFEAEMQPQLRATLQELQQLPQLSQQQPQGPSSQQPDHQQQHVLLLDTRNEQQYRGEIRRGSRGGHTPGAVSLSRAAFLDDTTDQLKSLQDQQQLLQQAGVRLPGAQAQQQAGSDGGQRVILYCNGGVAACTAALALHRLGHRSWAVYDGSWNEYAASDLPVSLP